MLSLARLVVRREALIAPLLLERVRIFEPLADMPLTALFRLARLFARVEALVEPWLFCRPIDELVMPLPLGIDVELVLPFIVLPLIVPPFVPVLCARAGETTKAAPSKMIVEIPSFIRGSFAEVNEDLTRER